MELLEGEEYEHMIDLIEDRPIFKIKNKNTGFWERKVLVECAECKKQRFQRIDKFINRKTDMCHYCNGKKNFVTNPIHNLSHTRCYMKYMNMLHRCYTPQNKSFKHYGGRGIGVCMEWLGKDGFLKFYDWCISNGWKEDKQCKLQIDRIDNEEDYSPDNCQLISQLENLKKMNNLFGVEGRTVKKGGGKPPPSQYADVLEKIKSPSQKETGEKLVPLWDWLENLGKNLNR
jgi:hypothetical protein